MSERRLDALRAMAAMTGPENAGQAAAARHALAKHAQMVQTALPVVEGLPPGPDLTRRGRPFPAKVSGGEVWVAVRLSYGSVDDVRAWVEDRRRMLVTVGGERRAMTPNRVEVDHERQTVHVVGDFDSLGDW